MDVYSDLTHLSFGLLSMKLTTALKYNEINVSNSYQNPMIVTKYLKCYSILYGWR